MTARLALCTLCCALLLARCSSSPEPQSATSPAVDGGPDAADAADVAAGEVDEPERPVPSRLGAIWATEGGDKVPREELRVSQLSRDVRTSLWDGSSVRLFGARSEVLGFVLVLEGGASPVEEVSVRFEELLGPDGARIGSVPLSEDRIFDWTERNIELFFVRYLAIKGLSRLTWSLYDERHIPERFQRPHDQDGIGTGGWNDRPDHDKHYPDIAVPMELVPTFTVPDGRSQSVWVDIYIPKRVPAGIYTGRIVVREGGKLTRQIPVELIVRDFTLPDRPHLPVMVQLGYGDVCNRYLGQQYPNPGVLGDAAIRIRDRHFQVAHRHKLALVDANQGPAPWDEDAPRPEWWPRLNGDLFTAAQGYDGPGVAEGNGVFSIGTYGSWGWQNEDKAGMWSHTDAWAAWFEKSSPQTEVFLYLIDEASDFPLIEKWASWMAENPGPGKRILSMATIGLVDGTLNTPSLQVPTASLKVAETEPWQTAADLLLSDPRKRLWLYNGARPASGTLALEDDGVALRQIAWVAFKKRVERWFYWESTYYHNFQGGTGQTNVFQTAQTFGGQDGYDPELGQTGWNYTNGDGVLFYPGTDTLFPEDSYGIEGPMASMRLKYMRRGVQDADYLALAEAVAPERVRALVDRIISKVLWEYGVDNSQDPSYTYTDISWSNRPDVWEGARRELADIIEAASQRR